MFVASNRLAGFPHGRFEVRADRLTLHKVRQIRLPPSHRTKRIASLSHSVKEAFAPTALKLSTAG